MNDFEKIEHLLLSKKFEELSPTEVKEVNGYFESATDYNDMRDTLMQVKSTLAADKLLVKPNVELKEKLLQQFDKTYTQKSGGGSLGKSRPFYKNVAFQWSAAASVVIIISVSIFGYIQNMNGKKSDGMAVNYEAKKDGAPSEESTISTGETPIGTATEKETDGKNRVTTVNPEYIGDSRNEDETEKPKLYGNFYTTESEVGEGEVGNSQNGPVKDNDIITFSSTRDDNTTLGGYVNTTIDTKEEKKDDANYYFNDKIITNANRQNEDLKGQDKNLELNTTIPVQNQGMTNTTIDYKKKANKREYWSKNKNKNKPKKDQTANVGMENANVPQSTDSNKVKLDSINIDSNKNLLEKNGDIQMQDNKKED